jgi:hypothetical protein
MRIGRLVTLLLTLVCFGVGAGPSAQAEDPQYTWEGVWDTNFGRMTLDASGSGSYEWEYPGTITGHVQGDTLEGTWVQPGNQSKGTLTFTMSSGGRGFTGEWQYDSGGCGSHTCRWRGSCIAGACLSNKAPSSAASPSAPSSPLACPLADLVVSVGTVSGEAAYRNGAGEWQPLKTGDRLPANAEVFTGVDSRLTLTFLDGGTFDMGELTQVLMDTLTNAESRKTVQLQLKLGEIKASVKKEQILDCNFEIKTPTCAASVRGTIFTVSHDEKSDMTVVSVEESAVSVDPVAEGLATTLVNAGEEVAVSRTAISPVTARGRAASELQESGAESPGSESAGDESSGDDGLSPVVIGLAVLLLLGVAAGLVMARGRAGRPGTP